jgi:hypothetical protein
MVSVSRDVEGLIREEQVGACKHILCPLLSFARARASSPWLLIPWGLEVTQTYLRTLASAHLSTVVLPPSSWYLQISETEQTMKERVTGRTSLAVLYSRHLGMFHH